jgi:hypothetical protein
MDLLRRLNRITLTTLAAGVLMTNGCLPHAQLRPVPIGTVSPENYCPGDTVTASYSLLSGAACVSRPGMDCSTIAPTLTISGTPASFPPQSFNSLTGGLSFMPTEPRVDILFAMPSSPTSVMYPSVNPMTGAATFSSGKFANTTHAVRRIDVEMNRMLTHSGMCAGMSAVYAPATLAGMPADSPSLRLRRVCNTSPVAITVTLTSAAGDFNRNLGPGACFSLDEPGVPSGVDASVLLAARPQTIDPGQCDPLQGTSPPPALTTTAIFACGT